jgi:hypothetical protein
LLLKQRARRVVGLALFLSLRSTPLMISFDLNLFCS